jgi:hypothetical protein
VRGVGTTEGWQQALAMRRDVDYVPAPGALHERAGALSRQPDCRLPSHRLGVTVAFLSLGACSPRLSALGVETLLSGRIA